jgi:serine/threonine protein kinase
LAVANEIDLGIDGIGPATMLARGGSAYVYLAEQTDFGRKVAVKVLFNALEDDATYRRFDRECRAIGAVSSHPNIVVVHGRGLTADERPYLIMEHRAGGSLAEALAVRGRFPENEVINVGIKIGTALAVAHDAGVLHRDVKPGNILLSAFNEPALADFGIARMEGAHKTTEGVFAASVVHASREVLNSEEPTPRSDVYALGSSLFELATGAAAFADPADKSIWAVVNRVLAQEPPEPTEFGVSPGLSAVLRKAMDHSPDRRHRSAAEFVADLERLRDGSGVADTPTRPLPEVVDVAPARPASQTEEQATLSRSGALWSAAVVVVATAGLAGFALFATSTGDQGADDRVEQADGPEQATTRPSVEQLVSPVSSETTTGPPVTPVETTSDPGPTEPLVMSFPRSEVGPLRIGEPYVVQVRGGVPGATYRVIIDNQPVTATGETPPPFFAEAGRHQLQVQAVSERRVELSEPVEIYVAHRPPTSGYRANLSSIRSEPENWPEALRQFDQMVADGHTELKLSVSNRTEANQLRPYWNYYVDGFGEDRDAAQAYCDDRGLDREQCLVARINSD